MASADGRIVIDIELEDGSVVRGLGDIGDQADRVGNRSSSAFAKAGSALKTVGTVAVGVVAGVGALSAAVVGLSIPLVKAAAEAQALNSQFSQVFGNLEKSAEASLQTIGNATQINAERLRGSFVRIAAFAKTTGVDTQAALDLSSRALTAAADSAAFYDRSIEDTTESLQSFLKGNYENDAALGISATETTRNATATRLFGQEFKALSEAQKQVALLEMVEEGNKLSGALGQAAREGDGLENVLGNLKQAYENFKVSLGDAILETAISLLKGLTDVIENIDTQPLADGLSYVIEKLKEVYDFVKPFAKDFADLLLGAIQSVVDFWNEGGEELFVNITENFTSIYNSVKSIIDKLTPYVENAIESIKNFWEEDGQEIYDNVKRIFDEVYATIESTIESIAEIVGPILEDIALLWEEYGARIINIVTFLASGVVNAFNFFLPYIQTLVEDAWDFITLIIDGALSIILGIVDVFVGIFTLDFELVWSGIKDIFEGAISIITAFFTTGFLGYIIDTITTFAKKISDKIKEIWEGIKKTFKESVKSVSQTVSGWVDSIVEFFNNLGTKTKKAAKDLWESIKTSFSNGVDKATDYVSGLVDDITGFFGGINLFDIGADIIQGLINGIGSLAGKIKKKVKEVASLIPNGIKSLLDIHSPSRVTTELGQFAGEGIEVGLDNSIRGISKATDNVVKAAIPSNMVNRLRGSTVGVSGISAGLLNGGTNASNVSNINNSQNPVYNINVQNNQTDAIERTIKRIQFGY